MTGKDKAIDLLKKIISEAEEHPAFMGWNLNIDEICEEGGDAAFITYDVAYNAKEAIDALLGDA